MVYVDVEIARNKLVSGGERGEKMRMSECARAGVQIINEGGGTWRFRTEIGGLFPNFLVLRYKELVR